MKSLISSALIAFALSPSIADAVLIEGLCDGTADSRVICDTGTGLEWLSLKETQLMSANMFLANPSLQMEGWSMATGAQVDALLLAAGFTDITGTVFDSSQLSAALLMLDLFGITGTTEINTGTAFFGQGFALESATTLSRPVYMAGPDFTSPDFALGLAFGSSLCGCVDYDARAGDVGVWANREAALRDAITIPEPGALALLAYASPSSTQF